MKEGEGGRRGEAFFFQVATVFQPKEKIHTPLSSQTRTHTHTHTHRPKQTIPNLCPFHCALAQNDANHALSPPAARDATPPAAAAAADLGPST